MIVVWWWKSWSITFAFTFACFVNVMLETARLQDSPLEHCPLTIHRPQCWDIRSSFLFLSSDFLQMVAAFAALSFRTSKFRSFVSCKYVLNIYFKRVLLGDSFFCTVSRLYWANVVFNFSETLIFCLYILSGMSSLGVSHTVKRISSHFISNPGTSSSLRMTLIRSQKSRMDSLVPVTRKCS